LNVKTVGKRRSILKAKLEVHHAAGLRGCAIERVLLLK
jgi:hypothetical protein